MVRGTATVWGTKGRRQAGEGGRSRRGQLLLGPGSAHLLQSSVYRTGRTGRKHPVPALRRVTLICVPLRFGKATMPIFNLFKNCSYYWGFAAFVSYFVNHPLYTPPPEAQTIAAFAVAAVCQLSNLWCHVILANLRTGPEDKGIKIPTGFLFNYISCANYTCEVCDWRARCGVGSAVYIWSCGVGGGPSAERHQCQYCCWSAAFLWIDVCFSIAVCWPALLSPKE